MILGESINPHQFSHLWYVDKNKTKCFLITRQGIVLCKGCCICGKDDYHSLGTLLLNPPGIQLVLAWNVALAGWSQPADSDYIIEKEASVHSHYMHYRLWQEGHTPVGSPSASGSQPASSNLSTNHLLAQLVISYYTLNPSNFNLFFWLLRYLATGYQIISLTNLRIGVTRCSGPTEACGSYWEPWVLLWALWEDNKRLL